MTLHPDDTRAVVNGSHGLHTATGNAPSAHTILTTPLDGLGLLDRCLLRTAALLARPKVLAVHGCEHIAADCDPFILALNHSTRCEALRAPAMLMLLRGGRRLHFLADWNFRMIPGIGLLYRRSGAITVTRKSARPRVLNVLKPLYTDRLSPMEQAAAHLMQGRSLALFPEGTVNRDPVRLLRGRYGVARLSLQTGASVVPAGLRFPTIAPGDPIPEGAPFEIRIGPALRPPPARAKASQQGLHDWHGEIMREIARLSGKTWSATRMEDV